MVLVPHVQFGFAEPGTTANYHKYLFNSFTQATNVNLSGSSFGGWTVSVHPTSLVAQPGISNTIGISVTVPVSPTLPWDVERTLAVSSGAQPYTATAYIVTIAMHHPFNDVAESDWSYGPVQYLAARNIVSGYPDGTFRPNELVTRAQFSKMMVTAMGWDVITPPSGHFSDVPADYWAYSYIETAAAHGAISGYSDGTFQPSAAVTRAQIAKMITVVSGWAMDMPDNPTYVDVSQRDWYFPYAEMMHAADIIQGYSDGTFRPNAPATRAQVAKILSLSLYSAPNQ
jgi:hypothetical protein